MKSSFLHKITFTFCAIILLASCASGPTPEQLANADYGNDVTPEECVAAAEQAVSNALRDPNSAQFRHNQCYQGWWNSVPILGMPVAFGWIQQGEVNGRNAFGGYVGFTPYQTLIRNGVVVRYCITDNDGMCMPAGR